MTDKKDAELDPIKVHAQRIKSLKKFKAISTDDINMSPKLIALSKYLNKLKKNQKQKDEVLAKNTGEIKKILLLFHKGDYAAIYDIGLISSELLVQVCVHIEESIHKKIKKLIDHEKITNAKKANGARGEKYNLIKLELKAYWIDNISPAKKATDAAVLLEKLDIFKNSSTQPKRKTLEGYVREWQKLPT